MFKGLGALGDMAKMMKSAQQMQQRMAELQQELETITVQGTSADGRITATATAKGGMVGLEIAPAFVDGAQSQALADLVLAAVQDAQAKAQERAAQEMAELSQELGLPADAALPA